MTAQRSALYCSKHETLTDKAQTAVNSYNLQNSSLRLPVSCCVPFCKISPETQSVPGTWGSQMEQQILWSLSSELGESRRSCGTHTDLLWIAVQRTAGWARDRKKGKREKNEKVSDHNNTDAPLLHQSSHHSMLGLLTRTLTRVPCSPLRFCPVNNPPQKKGTACYFSLLVLNRGMYKKPHQMNSSIIAAPQSHTKPSILYFDLIYSVKKKKK